MVFNAQFGHVFRKHVMQESGINPPPRVKSDTHELVANDDTDHTVGRKEILRQAAMLKTGALQNAILNSANFSIIATDERGIIQLFNIGAERMLGYSAFEVVNKISPSDIHDPQEVMLRADALSLELGTPINPGFEALAFKASRGIEDIYELTYVRKNGSRFPAIVSITALRDDYGTIIGYLLSGTDNSVRKQVEQQLQKAMEIAKKANLAKSEFLSSMSHELRTPLSAILGFAQLIESGNPAPTPSQKRGVNQILQAGWYLLDLINEILDLALIESGKLSLSIESVFLADLAAECRTMVEAQAKTRSVTLLFPRNDASYFVKADSTRLKQALINLLTNAIKYNKLGGAVTVKFEPTTAGGIRISVQDTGAGLTCDQQAQLFQPFNRLGQEENVETGTGIGLVVSKRLVELMGGSIGFECVEGVGSTFWIELSLADDPVATIQRDGGEPNLALAQQTALDTPTETALQTGVPVLPKYTLLYVEDNPANLMLVEEILSRRNDIRLISATDGNAGIQLARSAQPDLILMDINLPGIDGIRALKTLAQDKLTANIPVMALSANAMPRDIERGLAAGFFRYITKPIKVDAFLATLDIALNFVATGVDAVATQPVPAAARQRPPDPPSLPTARATT